MNVAESVLGILSNYHDTLKLRVCLTGRGDKAARGGGVRGGRKGVQGVA